MLNSQSPIPLYRQLADLILGRIRAGEYPVDSPIPSEHKLASVHGIGRPTARQATDRLVRQGILVRRRGSGTFVCAPRREVDLFSFAGTISSFHEQGISLTTRIVRKTGLKPIGDVPENPFSGRSAYFFSRVGHADNQPVLIEDFYLHDTLFSGIDSIDLSRQSLSHTVSEQYYMRPTGGRQNFRIGYLSGKRAALLDVSSATPILIVKRHLHFPQMADAIYSELFCRTEQFVFSQTLGDTTDG